MDLFCIDDAIQTAPTRQGMSRLVAVGGVHVPGESVRDLEHALGELCSDRGFPEGTAGEFKWSPGRELWMRNNLVEGQRETFFKQALQLAEDFGATAIVTIEDSSYSTAIPDSQSSEEDVVRMFLERAHNLLSGRNRFGIVLADKPSSNAEESRFLALCLETLQTGTAFVLPNRIALNVVTTSSHLVRILQLADLITSCSVSRAAGEDRFSPHVFPSVVSLLRQEYGRKGGCGLKLHPDYRYANLYHWLLQDSDFVRFQSGIPLPLANRPYYSSEYVV
jgi:hypothetical protein